MRKTIDKRILQEAQAEAELLTNNSTRKSAEIKKDGLDKITNEVAFKLEKALEANERMIAAYKNRQEKNLITYVEQIRQEIVVGVFDAVTTKIANLEGKELLVFVLHLLSKESVNGNEKIKVRVRNYEKYLAAFSSKKDPEQLDLLNAGNIKYKFVLEKADVPIREGFLISNPTFDLIFDFSELVDKYQEAHEQDVYGTLFTNE